MRVDDGFADDRFTRREIFHFELPKQVFAQRLSALVGKVVARPAFAVPAAVLDPRSMERRLPAVFSLDRPRFRRSTLRWLVRGRSGRSSISSMMFSSSAS